MRTCLLIQVSNAGLTAGIRRNERRRLPPPATGIHLVSKTGSGGNGGVTKPADKVVNGDAERVASPEFFADRLCPENSKLSFFDGDTSKIHQGAVATVIQEAPLVQPMTARDSRDLEDPYTGFEHRKIRNLRRNRQR